VPLQIEGILGLLAGELESVAALADRIQTRGVELGREQPGRLAAGRATRRALVYLGRAEEALGRLPEARGEFFFTGGVYWAQRALLLAHARQGEEVRKILTGFFEARDMSQPDDPTSASVLRYLLEAAVVVQDTETAGILERRMAPLAGLLHTEAEMIYNIGRLCGGAAVLQGDPEKARGYYNQALDVCTRVRFRPEIALTRLELAELLLEHYREERAEALDHLDFAIAEFREMKMQPSLERALKHKGLLTA